MGVFLLLVIQVTIATCLLFLLYKVYFIQTDRKDKNRPDLDNLRWISFYLFAYIVMTTKSKVDEIAIAAGINASNNQGGPKMVIYDPEKVTVNIESKIKFIGALLERIMIIEKESPLPTHQFLHEYIKKSNLYISELYNSGLVGVAAKTLNTASVLDYISTFLFSDDFTYITLLFDGESGNIPKTLDEIIETNDDADIFEISFSRKYKEAIKNRQEEFFDPAVQTLLPAPKFLSAEDLYTVVCSLKY